MVSAPSCYHRLSLVITLAIFGIAVPRAVAFSLICTPASAPARRCPSRVIDGGLTASKRTSSDAGVGLRREYARIRNIRTLQGHDAAVPFYQELLLQNTDDRTAGTRIAACADSPVRQDEACGGKFCKPGPDWTNNLLEKKSDIQKLKAMLSHNAYDHEHISQFFGVQQQPQQQGGSNKYLSCDGPLFVSPVPPGAVSLSNYPLFHTNGTFSGLSCLVALFLLSLVVPKSWIMEALGEECCGLMQDFGWIYPCSSDPSLMIPYVSVFPMDFTNRDVLCLVTDLHPQVISTTTLGTSLDQSGNAVMYIGPDSLALAQHFSPYRHFMDTNTNKNTNCDMHGLDLGTGSGIQALSALMHWKQRTSKETNAELDGSSSNKLKMTAIDINPRALRFTLFNAILNGLEEDVSLVHANLASGSLCGLDPTMSTGSSLEEYLAAQMSKFDLILANPPFLPVPSDSRTTGNLYDDDGGDCSDDDDDGPNESKMGETIHSIAQRYGLFSSGGGDGEVILQRIVELASRHLGPGGVLGIVSEFFVQYHDPDFERFSTWWQGGASTTNTSLSKSIQYEATTNNNNNNNCIPENDVAVLLLNEFPIDAATYAARRADNPSEETVWRAHLKSLNITSASPGMLYLQINTGNDLNLSVARVPKSNMGSVWTPSNRNAIEFTRNACRHFFGWL